MSSDDVNSYDDDGNRTSEYKSDNFLLKTMPPTLVSWFFAVLVGIGGPVLLMFNGTLGSIINAAVYGAMPKELTESGAAGLHTPSFDPGWGLPLGLLIFITLYLVLITFQFYTFVRTPSVFSLLPLPITLFGPFYIMVVLPFIAAIWPN